MANVLLRCTDCKGTITLPMKDLEYFQKQGFGLRCGTCRGDLVIDLLTRNNHSVLNGAARVAESLIKGAVNTAFPSPKSQPEVCICPTCGKWHRKSTYQYR